MTVAHAQTCARLAVMADRTVPTNVSDTARWVAAYRARETARPDAVFRDPLADRLAGPQGYAIADAAPSLMRNGWPVVTRTKLIDDLIAKSIAAGCDRVLNLAAGLDTRPYRLELPPGLLWIEADLPEMVAEKDAALAGETPRCVLRRHSVDLADDSARKAFLDEALGPHDQTGAASKALVLTEGLLVYLDNATVTRLAQDLARPEIAWWIADLATRITRGRAGSVFENAPLRFEPSNGAGFFEELGWQITDLEQLMVWARKLRRLPLVLRPFSYLPQPNPRQPGRTPWSAVIRFQHR